LALDKNGNLFGVAFQGGTGSYGTVFEIVAPPRVTVSSTTISFGNQVINSTSGVRAVTLTNIGAKVLNVTGVVVSTKFKISSNTCGATLAIGAKFKVGLTFTPQVLGKITGTLTFRDNAGDSPQKVILTGTGVLPTALTPTNATYAAQSV
jgi:hypothetical protein